MGEWSKQVGEAGEKLVHQYLKLIGWGDAQNNVPIACIKSDKHILSTKPRQTHGLDFLLSYPSPLFDEVLKNVVISVKFSAEEYPNTPAGIFRNHFKDLAQALECFKHSLERQKAITGRRGIRHCHDVGVLFWLNNSKQSYDDVISRLSNVGVSGVEGHAPIYVVDNKRIAFIYDSLAFAKRLYPNSEIEFYYFDTGKNTNPLTKQHSGPLLPVEFINTSILPLRVGIKSSDTTVLLLCSLENFSEDGLKLLLGLAKNLSGNWASKIVLCFPDYISLTHQNTVQGVKAAFSDKKTTGMLEVRSYAADFLTLQG